MIPLEWRDDQSEQKGCKRFYRQYPFATLQKVRNFASFRAAADEAGISRLYGGIHYRDAIDQGLAQGRSVGQTVMNRLD